MKCVVKLRFVALLSTCVIVIVPFDVCFRELFRVGAGGRVAPAMAKSLRAGNIPLLHTVGVGPINQALKAISEARRLLRSGKGPIKPLPDVQLSATITVSCISMCMKLAVTRIPCRSALL